ncbi:hypothetical protein [Streptomyces sp. NPDC003247]|uniref:hypothetical protein n=1 Tax=Streptomyces sp. NPDC003247 TaxID=3364677 RepID=UPI0036C628BA
MEEAVRYAERIRSRGGDVEIVTFRGSGDDFASMKRADIVSMTPEQAEAFVDTHSRLYGDGLPHDYDYIRGHIGMGDEHYFTRHVFPNLKF